MMHVTFLGAIAWKGSLILVVAFVAAACLRRAPAAARHMLWTAALGALLVLPLAIVVEPQWNMRPAIRTAPAVEHVSDTLVHNAATTAGPEAIHLPPYFWLVLWIMGGSAVSVRLAAGTLRARECCAGPGPRHMRSRCFRPVGQVRNAPAHKDPRDCGCVRSARVRHSNAGYRSAARRLRVERNAPADGAAA